MTEQEIQDAMEYVARTAMEGGANLQDVGSVVRWMIENPLPDQAIWEADLAARRSADRVQRLETLRTEVTKLEREIAEPTGR